MKKTAENDFNKAVECIVKSDFYNDLNKCLDMVKLLDKNKELQERIEDLNIINEEHKILNGMIRKELQQKENIIKEVREYLEKHIGMFKNGNMLVDINVDELLEILGGENNDK